MQEQTSAQRTAILVVDDNEVNRLLAQSTLEDEGYNVILAAGGAEGIAAFEKDLPDCILLDVRMPDTDGFAVCEAIRRLPGGADTPIVFLTALRDVETFDRALRVGGDDFLTKPIRPTELVLRVQSALKLRRVRAELREHYDLLKRQRDDLQRVQLQKERLMAFVVHDLKNPVNAMDLHAQVLLRARELPETLRDSVAQIRTEARQLTRLILNLLDLSKSEEGKLSPNRSEVDLNALVAEVFAELDANAQSRAVRLRASIETDRVHADPDLLRRTLANLVDNAIRYAPSETVITVSTRRSVSSMEVRVADAGKGIPPELRDRVFDAFIQVEAGERPVERGARGLGLTFCKLAVEAHGGSIWVEDGAPGAIFILRLPVS
jgi:two-component system, sensor histidine kinase and response regulator